MIINYIKSAFRSLQRNKLHSALNIFGLAFCISVLTLSILYIKNETSYDKSFDRANDIYRVGQVFNLGGENEEMLVTSQPLAKALEKEVPEVEAATRLYGLFQGTRVFRMENDNVFCDKVARVDNSFLKVFSFPLLYGDPEKALQEPGHLLISEDLSYTLFGNENPVGKSVEMGSSKYKRIVDGVIKKTKDNIHFYYDVYEGYDSYEVDNDMWGNQNNFHTYVKLKEGASFESFANNANQLQWKYVLPIMQPWIAGLNKTNCYMFFTPITDIHLKSNRLYELSSNGNITYVYIALLLALIIIGVAAINYINLATAQSARRAKEIGVRKVSGSNKKMLVTQFTVEAIVQSYIAMVLGLIITELLLPYFNSVLATDITLLSSSFASLLLLIFAITTVIGFVSGIFPAFVLSRFEPVKVLKGSLSASKKGGLIRKTLVITQFVVSAILIVMVMFIYKQVNFMHSKDLGFDKQQVLSVKLRWHKGGTQTFYEPFRQEMLKNNAVEVISFSSNIPGDHYGQNGFDTRDGKSESFNFCYADSEYIKAMGFELIKGENFMPIDTASRRLIVNEAFIKKFKIEGDPVGQIMGIGDRNETIIGVIKDFHIDNFDKTIAPLALCNYENNPINEFVIRFNSENVGELVNTLETKWKEIEPIYPLQITFLDDRFAQIFAKQEQFGKLFIGATLFTVLVAMLGLFGLASFSAQQRKREIGIRKVMGASDSGIMYMLIAEFVKLVIIASVISTPVAYYLADKWLSGFAYHTSMSILPFVLTFIVTMIIAVVTVAWQAHLASSAKPVDVIRYE